MSIASNIGVADNYIAEAEVLRYLFIILDPKCSKEYYLQIYINYFKNILQDGYLNPSIMIQKLKNLLTLLQKNL